ncbi:MAG: hypothetical protein ACO2PL_20255 [Armatimonadota bacterium]
MWQFVETFLPKEQLGDDWKASVLVVLGKYEYVRKWCYNGVMR